VAVDDGATGTAGDGRSNTERRGRSAGALVLKETREEARRGVAWCVVG